ncbi:hypothetical protein FIU87_20825 [Bacillus sp. THAF10]|nr:hypothetical protein FIU87_20825 [Bacillus sp. THAF10]
MMGKHGVRIGYLYGVFTAVIQRISKYISENGWECGENFIYSAESSLIFSE